MKSTMEISLTNKSLTIFIGGTSMNKLIQSTNVIYIIIMWLFVWRWDKPYDIELKDVLQSYLSE